jgi:uncharacterized protein
LLAKFIEKHLSASHVACVKGVIALLLFAALWTPGCGKRTGAASPANSATNSGNALHSDLPTTAQPKLPTTKLWLGSEELMAELARTDLQMQTGMMFRTNMAESEGMLFLFPWPHRAAFWMANTVVPLSAAYISPEGTILELHDLKPLDTNTVSAATDQVQFVLETNEGWFKRHNIKEGMLVRSERGSLQQLLRGK